MSSSSDAPAADDAGNPNPPATANPNPPAAAGDAAGAPEDDRVYLVPYRWWTEARESLGEVAGKAMGIPFTASPVPSSYSYPMKIIGSILGSDLVFNLKRDEESVVDDSSSGRSYALIPSNMWSQGLKWHNDTNLAANNGGGSFFTDDCSVDVYPLGLRISCARETRIMTVRISKKDNLVENYKRAFKIFSVDSETVRIWDFSGQTELIIMNEWNRMSQDGPRQSDQEILLHLQVYALSECTTPRSESRKDDSSVQQSKMLSFPCGSSFMSNGNMESDISISGSSKRVGLGLTGLENLGNTCFMNSAIQCLTHTPKLVEYFLGDYSKEINNHNPLGMNGEIALAFGDLLRKLWAPDRQPVVPRFFKSKLSRFAPQFSGFNQHDSQELLAFLLDGLHEDLNRVKHKPYIEVKDASGRPDEEVADEYWENHLARNDSIIVDVCQGQYRSTLVCPVCSKVSVTFDPFMYLSLPLPSSAMRTMTVTVFSTDGSAGPSSYTINVPKTGKYKDFIHALSAACLLRDDEYLLVAEVFCGRIIRYLEDPYDLLSLIRDGDRLAAYRLAKDPETPSLVVYTHQRLEEHYMNSIMPPRWKAFGVPLIAKLPSTSDGSSVRNLLLKVLKPFRQSANVALDDDINEGSGSVNEVVEMDTSTSSHLPDAKGLCDVSEEGNDVEDDFQFYTTDEKCQLMTSRIQMNALIPVTGMQKLVHVLVCWQDKSLKEYDTSLLSSLPEIQKSGLLLRRPQEPVSLYTCLEAFLKEEPLGPEDMWYCPSCKKHQQASKKLDLWRLPEVLVIHLKRFSYSRFLKNKLETLIDFPIHDLDLSDYIARKTNQQNNRYELYAVSNHYGGMGGGHYTAYAYHEGEQRWYDFDDRHVLAISEDNVKTSAAYVLFYRRVKVKSSTKSSTDT